MNFRVFAHNNNTLMFPIHVFLSVEEQSITASDLIQQDIDINEPVGNLKKLLEPRIQISLDAYEICLQDIQVMVPRDWTHRVFSFIRLF